MSQELRHFLVKDFDFDLPEALIAQYPSAVRSASRLLDANIFPPVDHHYRDLPKLLKAGDLLVFNDTKVIKARLFGVKETGGKCEILVERILDHHEVIAHLKVSKKPAIQARIRLITHDRQTVFARMLGRWPDEKGGLFHLSLESENGQNCYQILEQYGHVPLPPYITHADEKEDESRYQTVFAAHPGSVAAPTASLHFDEGLLNELEKKGIERAFLTLHVGAGTFAPVKTEHITEHVMHHERYQIPDQTVEAIERCQARGSRIIAVGTTSVRTLESWAKTGKMSGDTNIFITPGFKFKVVDLMLTNFHLPQSTLMMLVSAFAGYDKIRSIYQMAIERQYRFFSYGDGMLLERQ